MMNKLSQQDLRHFADALRKILGQSAATSDKIEAEYLDRGAGGLDTQGDAGADGEFEEVDLDALDLEEGVAEAAIAALKRISDGTYGQCSLCKEGIPRGRLEAVPYAPLCVSCQEKEEQTGEET